MLGYVMAGTNDLQKSAKFYDAILEVLGAKRTMDYESFIAWGKNENDTAFCLTKPFDGKPATVGNGTMFAFFAPDNATVDKVYAIAMEIGATDEGAPGPRPEYDENFYAGYFRDPDGNKLNVFHFPKS